MLDVIVIIIVGWLAGVIVNAFADDLPYRRNPGRPTYPDGTPRPLLAWSGIVAFLLNLRKPDPPRPDPTREREYVDEPRLSWRYPLTEVLTIGLMLLSLYATQTTPDFTTMQLIFWLVYMAIFALIIVIDMEHKLILFVVIIPSALLALADATLLPVPGPSLSSALLGGVVGFVIFYLLYQGGFLFTYLMGRARGQKINTVAFGYGDVMMITLSGLILGLPFTVLAIFLTVFIGAFGALAYLTIKALLSGRYSAFTALPYGPYIVIATIIMMLFGEQVQYALMGF